MPLFCCCSFCQCKCIDPDIGCGLPKYKGDGNCDDDNNNEACDYDGGDCCAKTVKGGVVKTPFCKQVINDFACRFIASNT